VMLFYIPIEIYVNGTKLIGAVLLMIILGTFTLVFHYFRLFRLGQIYLFMVGTLFVIIMGLVVGRTVGNHVILVPIVLLATIMFKSKTEKIALFLVIIISYLVQRWLFDIITPLADISEENKQVFAVIFFVLALIFTFVIGIYFLGTNKEYESIIVMQKENLELKNKEITDSITYAKRIQTAILPPDPILKKHLKDFFILYLPKDGDTEFLARW
jgi:hypothetical protein